MARQSFIWTALPNGYTPDGSALRLSVMLSPRLDLQAPPPPGPQRLKEFFPDWKDWPATLRQARFSITYNGATIKVKGDKTVGPNRLDDHLGLADSTVFQAIFKGDLLVRSFAYTDLSDHRILSYDTVGLAGLIESLYTDLARNADGNLPLISDIADDRTWSALISTITELDQSSFDRHTGLRNPARQFERFVAHAEPGRRFEASLAELERFQLFHTPPATPKARQQAREDDPRIQARWLEHKQTPLPKKEDLAKELDFHRIVAAMGSYPTLMRRLGLVVDLLLDPSDFSPAADAALSVEVTFPSGALKITCTKDAAPVTRTRLDAQHFEAVSDPAAAFHIKNRLLDLAPDCFQLLQLDVDSAGLKVMNFARSLARRDTPDKRVDSVTRHEDTVGAPSLRTAGLMLVHRDRASFLKGRFDANKTGNNRLKNQFQGPANIANEVSLHAEDLVRGYRIDIWDSMTGMWRSLCRRTARYELEDGAVVVEPTPEEEGTVRLGATQSSDPTSNPKLLYLHEALVSWTGWSLTAPPPGRSIRPDDTVDTARPQSEAEIPPGLKFKCTFKPVTGSLPRLRFGRAYAMRVRAVDLAGNSLDPQTEDFGTELAGGACEYLRYEPVESPIIALLSQGGAIEKPAEGESISRIAIRSFNDIPADNMVATSQIAHRVAAPPRVSVREVEQHGKLDVDGKVDRESFSMLAHQKDIDPRDATAAIRDVTIPVQGPLEAEAGNTTFAVFEAGRALTYLPDPLALEVAARIFDHPNISDTEIITIPLYPTSQWPEAEPFQIELYDDPAEKPYFDATSRRLRVPLPKAVRARVRLSMKLSFESLEIMGVFRLLTDTDKIAQRDRARDGQHWMLTPWRVIDVVHAVQRPLLAPEISTISVLPRALGVTSARPIIHANCSIASTDRLDLRAEWHEPMDDAAEPADRPRRDIAFQVKVTDAKSYASRELFPKAGGYPDHMIDGPDSIGVNTGGGGPSWADGEPFVQSKAHEFHDTRYRRIEYWFDATTQFREFLPLALQTRVESGETVPDEKNIKVTGPRAVTWIPNSAPPPAPKVLYVVPTFGWTRNIDANGQLSSWRRGGGLRVYLDRPWNVSGYGEMLGVILPPAGFTENPDEAPKGQPYREYITQWGNDPVWDAPFVEGIAPHRSDFPLARTAPDANGSWLPPGAPETEKEQKPGAFQVTGLQPPRGPSRGSQVEVAPHDVFFDPDRRLWYCDIEIKTGASYYPFIRLALARYQPVSSPQAHLSNVVLADIMALTADRWLNVTPAAEPGRCHVAVFGVRAYESSGHHEAAHAPSMSLINLSGELEDLKPAQIAEHTSVEIWIERLEERWGEDFGWRRLDDAVITGGPPDSSGSGLDSPKIKQVESIIRGQSAAVERLQTLARLEAPEFGATASERLLEIITPWRTLWEGDVTLPATSEGRHRLVIAEYEEYLVDDKHPYDNVPTRMDRRLVFVEHIELRR